MKVARQALLEFGRREKVVNRQIRQRVAGEKVTRGPGRPRRQDRTKVGVSHAARAEAGCGDCGACDGEDDGVCAQFADAAALCRDSQCVCAVLCSG